MRSYARTRHPRQQSGLESGPTLIGLRQSHRWLQVRHVKGEVGDLRPTQAGRKGPGATTRLHYTANLNLILKVLDFIKSGGCAEGSIRR